MGSPPSSSSASSVRAPATSPPPPVPVREGHIESSAPRHAARAPPQESVQCVRRPLVAGKRLLPGSQIELEAPSKAR